MCRSSRWRHRDYSFSDEATWYHSTMVSTIRNFEGRPYKLVLLYVICDGRRHFSKLWPSQRRNATLRKNVTEYDHMRKLMVKFFITFESRGIKISLVSKFSARNLSIDFNLVSLLQWHHHEASFSNELTCWKWKWNVEIQNIMMNNN